MVGDRAAEDLVPGRLADGLEVLLGQLPGRLDGLGPAAGEEHPVQVAWCHGRQALGQLDGLRVRIGPEREVGELARLPRRGLGDLGPAMADLAHEQPGQPVQVALAVLVIDVLALAAHDDRDVARGKGRHPGEVQPQMALGLLLEGSDLVLAVCRAHLVPQL